MLIYERAGIAVDHLEKCQVELNREIGSRSITAM